MANFTKEEIHKLIDDCPYIICKGGTDWLNKANIRKWFILKFDEKEEAADIVLISKKYFDIEIGRLWNQINQIRDNINSVNHINYPPLTTSVTGVDTHITGTDTNTNELTSDKGK